MVDLISWTFPGDKVNLPFLQNKYIYTVEKGSEEQVFEKTNHEKVPLNVCLYENMYLFKWIAILDVDEIFVPQQNMTTWSEMMIKLMKSKKEVFPGNVYNKELDMGMNFSQVFKLSKSNKTMMIPPETPSNIPSWRFQNYYFVSKDNENSKKMNSFPMMNSLSRDKEEHGYGKSIINPALVKAVYNHGAHSVLHGQVRIGLVDPLIGRCHHYRDIGQDDRYDSLKEVFFTKN